LRAIEAKNLRPILESSSGILIFFSLGFQVAQSAPTITSFNTRAAMSALGQNATLRRVGAMSVYVSRADIH
jgi:hypothetical protein